MQTIERLLTYPEITTGEAERLRGRAADIIEGNLEQFTDAFQPSNSTNGFYTPSGNTTWTTGFWTGEIWLAYEKTGSSRLRAAGERQVESFLERIRNKVDVAHHDMGFLYSPSCVAAWKLTGNAHAREAAVLAADNLMERFQEKGGFFQAWGALGAEDNYRLIIDCLLNMPLLFWAGEVTGNPDYRQKAAIHIQNAMKYVIRPDHSTYHTYFFDPATGEPRKGVTHQGYRDGSAWARGQAWGIYGAALSYSRLKNPEYIDIFEIWSRTGILISRMAVMSQGTPPRRRQRPAVCWKWQSTCLNRRRSITEAWLRDSSGRWQRTVQCATAESQTVCCCTGRMQKALRIIHARIWAWTNVLHGGITTTWKH